ncbi:S-Ena type endospore appendage [Paenibacillus filicis]|uniref:S-Ena type endospore appendage n=1 Tax=Paenibacillus filicis TaxID=669464 RepID=A0ABU9DX05_9BACL
MSCRGGFGRGPSVAESNFSCCNQVTFVQDQVCFSINITPVATEITQDLYTLNVNPTSTYVSGTLTIGTAPAGRTITVNFLLGGPGGTIVYTDTITTGTALAFTRTGFDTIQLVVAAGVAVTPNITGELCVTPRYPVSA